MFIKTKNPLPVSRGRVLPRGTTSIYRISCGLIRSQQTVSAISGAPVSTYCNVQQSRSERYSARFSFLPCTVRQFSGRRMVALTKFRHRVYNAILYHFFAVKSTRNATDNGGKSTFSFVQKGKTHRILSLPRAVSRPWQSPGTSRNCVILSEHSESKDLRTQLTASVKKMRRFFDSAPPSLRSE